jgi:hypothetical protein
MPDARSEYVDQYRQYLQRYDDLLGPCEFGAYTKHKGRLIKKLRYDEFEQRWREFMEVEQAYSEIMARGDTINDVLVKILRERCDEFLLERKV